jgi:DNA repair exonuclease SbcCD nuclease subunit
MRILHIADVHLDRPFVDLGTAEARARRAEVRDTFRRALELAEERRVDLITIGGDLWEDENVVADTRLSVARELERTGVPVAIVAGNHDPLLPGGNYLQTQWPDNVRIFGGAPEELAIGDVSVWGVSWTTDRLSAEFLNTFQAPEDGRTHLLLVHGTAVTNPHFAEASRHCPFDPRRAAAAGFDAVLCGHIHAASWSDGVIYPGSPEPLNWSEVGRHCVAIIETGGKGALNGELLDINQRRYAFLAVDCSRCESSTEVVERVQLATSELVDPQRVCLKLELTGRVGTEAVVDPDDIRSELVGQFDLVRVVNSVTRAWDLDALKEQPTADGRFVAELVGLRDDAVDARERRVIELALEAGLSAMRGNGPILHVD